MKRALPAMKRALLAARRLCSTCLPLFRPVVATLALALLGAAAHAQDSTLVRLLQRNTQLLTLQGATFTGPGWEKLRQEAQQSQFIMLGEDHGTAQIPVLAQALAQAQHPAAYLAEIDQYQAQDLTALLAKPGLPTAYTHQYPMGLSFYSWAEEYELARYFRAQHVPLIGLDQVSIVSTSRFLTRLAEQVHSPAARRFLLSRAAAFGAQDLATMRQATNHYSLMYLPASTLDSLRTLTRQEGPAVQQQVQALAASHEIYHLTLTAGRRSHQLRVDLMKRNLLTALRPYQTQPGQPLPKLFFKFGAFHVARGLSLLSDVYDLGNLVSNLADAQDATSLHLFVIGRQGTRNQGFNPDDFSKNAQPYSNAKELKLLASLPPAGAAWQVIDLRPLRRALLNDKLRVSKQDLATLLLGYDYLVLLPETTASHNY